MISKGVSADRSYSCSAACEAAQVSHVPLLARLSLQHAAAVVIHQQFVAWYVSAAHEDSDNDLCIELMRVAFVRGPSCFST